jgi:hypothetical protein
VSEFSKENWQKEVTGKNRDININFLNTPLIIREI